MTFANRGRPDTAHHVVCRRANLHRHLRDVDIRKLLELVVHAWKFLFDVLGGVGNSLFNPGDVEENAPWGCPVPLAPLA